MSWLQRLNARMGNGFARAVGVLVGGTALGHAITAAALPILSRLYSPAEFGVLAAFAAITSTLAVAACLRYEIAIALPAADDEAISLVGVAAAAALVGGALLAILLLPSPVLAARILGQEALAPFLWLIPLCVTAGGLFSALQYWNVRRKAFSALAATRVLQSGAASGSQLAGGWLALGPGGLIAGPLMNGLAGLAWLARRVRTAQVRRAATLWGPARLWAVARAHRRFPLFSAPEALANAASIHLPILVIAAMAGATEAGHLLLAMTVVQAPMSLLGSAVGQVYLSRAADEHRLGRLGELTSDVIGGLARTAVGPLVFIGLVAPVLFDVVFGAGWERAGIVVAWLTPWFVLNLLTAPISMAMHVCGRQRLALGLQIGGLALRLGGVWLAGLTMMGFWTEAYAVSGLLFYGVYLAAVLRIAACTPASLATSLKRAIGPLVLWCAAGIATLVAVAGLR